MPDDLAQCRLPMGNLVFGVLAIGVLTALPGCPTNFATPSPVDGSAKTAFMQAANREDPLEIGPGILALEPQPSNHHSGSLAFSSGSRYFAWLDDSLEQLWVAYLGSVARQLAPFHKGSFQPDWSADGTKLLVSDLSSVPKEGVTTTAVRTSLYALSTPEQAPIVLREGSSDVNLRILPDGSGAFYVRPVASTGTPLQQNAAARQLYLVLPGQGEQLETTLGGPAVGEWSPDARRFAYLEYRDHDPTKGLALRVYDRSSKQSAIVAYVETDDLRMIQENLSWSPTGRISFTSTSQDGASASIAITTVATTGEAATLTVIPVSLKAGQQMVAPHLSPDQRWVTYEALGKAQLTVGAASGEVPQYQGIYVASLKDGRSQELAPRGRVVSWLPGSVDLICATGRSDQTRYYRLELPAAKEANE